MQRNSQQNGNGNGGGGRRIADRINGAGGAPRLTRFQRELVESNRQLQAEVLELKRFNRAATRRTDLVELENAGFVLDVEDELARLTDMDETRYDRELDRIIKRYQRLPVNQRPIPIADPDEEVATERPGDPDEELFAYAQEHGLKGEEAMRRFRQDKGKGRDTQPAGKGGDGQRLRRS